MARTASNIKRRDKKGRVLRENEYQQKDGRYKYRCKDVNGKYKYCYSWKLEETDPLPRGKKRSPSLRKMEKKIQRDLMDGIVPDGGKYTVLDIVKKYTRQREKEVRQSTREGYRTVINILKKEGFGSKEISKVKVSNAREWYKKLQETDGRSYSSIHSIHGVLKPAFQMAVDDDLIRKNPFQFPLTDAISNDRVRRKAITHDQMEKFLEFVKNDSHFSRYYEGIYILFHTGMRISEFTGLTLEDIDMDKREIHIEHQLQRRSNMEYVIEKPKTESVTRILPMTEKVYECFAKIIRERKPPDPEEEIGDKKGFLYFDKNGNPMVALHWEKYFERICKKYNKTCKDEEKMPKVTPHVCRHTYCSVMASKEVYPEHLKYLMGHSDISITSNTYTHIEFEDVRKSVEAIDM